MIRGSKDTKSDSVVPRIGVSRCLLNQPVRYNGLGVNNVFVSELRNHVEFVDLCPEVDIGLTTPRPEIKLFGKRPDVRIMNPNTGEDYTLQMREYATSVLSKYKDLDGWILKAKSPSCGIREINAYKSLQDRSDPSKGSGLFGHEIFGNVSAIVEDEKRLLDTRLRTNFLTRIFLRARFREYVKGATSISRLIDFHSRNKLILMAYNQAGMRVLGNVCANHNGKELAIVIQDYEEELGRSMSRLPSVRSHLNVIDHAFGYFSKALSKSEREHFLEVRSQFSSGYIPLAVPVFQLRGMIKRFEEEYLGMQTYFSPFPSAFGREERIS